MITINDKTKCSGCTACASICPNVCIEMIADNEGFKYPKVDRVKCNNCHLCESVCPIKNQKQIKKENTVIYIVQNKDDEIRKKSSAGGFYGAISEYVLALNGVVFGAEFDAELMVRHGSVKSMKEWNLSTYCGSKYVQSDMGQCFKNAKNNLDNGKIVCFSGLPCQVAGLKSFLGKEYDNLILIDLTCYGAPSPKLYKKYLEHCSQKYNSRIIKVNFRDKSYGYSSPNMRLMLENGKIKEQNSTVKSFLRAFFSGMSSRPSCYQCVFKTVERVSDFTLGDCKNIGKFFRELDDDKGTTVVYVHTTKGMNVINNLKEKITVKVTSKEQILKTCGKKMIESDKQNFAREHFFKDIDTLSYEKLIQKYVPPAFDERIANIIKPMLYKMGLIQLGILKKIIMLYKY